MISTKVYYNVGLLAALVLVFIYVPIAKNICIFMSGIALWNIFDGLSKRIPRPRDRIVKTPFSASTNNTINSNWSNMTPLTPVSPLAAKKPTYNMKVSQNILSTLNKQYEKAKHTTDNNIQQYPKEINEQQVILLKTWIVSKILRPFMRDLKTVDSVYSLEKRIDHHNKSIPFGPIEDAFVECEEEFELHSDNKWVIRRLTYEIFLQIPSTDQTVKARKYLLQRVQELAQHSQLINYCSDSRSIVQFQPTFPTDGQIILHFVDVFLKINAPYHSQSILQFICCMNRLPDEYGFTYRRSLYKLSDKENLFRAIVAFMLYIQEECAGYFGLLNMSTPMVGTPNLIKK
eukprot:NODE_327_length_9598_cov_1.179914.p3 type:complete len:345 gc:universal NODE_327_length_9598_cov_1.179914:1467-2501(+)